MIKMCAHVNFGLEAAQIEIHVNQADATGRGPHKDYSAQL